MKLLFFKFSLFCFLYLVISSTITHFLPYHWGNPWYSAKVKYLEKNNIRDYNVFFFGSSRIYRQVNPEIFDKLNDEFSSGELTSFNLGAPATFCPQSYYLFENFLKSNFSNNVKYCFLELGEVDLLNDSFLHQERTTYWQNLSDLVFVIKSLYHSKRHNRSTRISSTLNYLTSYSENLTHLGHFGQEILNPNYGDSLYLGGGKNGFLPLDIELKTTNDKEVRSHLFERNQTLLSRPEILTDMKADFVGYYDNETAEYDEVNLSRIMKLISMSKSKGIELFLVLPPRTGNENLIALSRKLPAANLIDLCNPIENGVFYELNYSFDSGHLNMLGAEIFTKLLFEQFNKRKQELDN